MSEAETIQLDHIVVDYFDPEAYFAIAPQVSDGSIAVTLDGGSNVTASDYLTAFDFRTDALRSVTYSATSLSKDVTSASSIFVISAAENVIEMSQSIFDALTNGVDVGNSKTGYNLTSADHRVSANGLYVLEGDDTAGWHAYAVSGTTGPYTVSTTPDIGLPGGRQAQAQIDVDFTIHRTPSIEIEALAITPSETSAVAGVALGISGVTVADVDSDAVTLTLSSNIAGEFSLADVGSVAQSVDENQVVSISGAPSDVETAINGLSFIPDDAGNFVISITVDDGDLVHDRNSDGSLKSTALNSRMSADTLDLAMSQATFDALTNGVDVGNSKTGYNLTSSEHRVSADGLYVVEGSDAAGWLAYAVSGTTGSYSVSQTADAGSPFVVAAAPPEIEQTFIPNLKIGDTFWSKFSGISVSDFDTDTGLTLTITSGLLDLAMSQATFDALTNGVDVGNSKTGYNLTSSEHRVSADGLYVVEVTIQMDGKPMLYLAPLDLIPYQVQLTQVCLVQTSGL